MSAVKKILSKIFMYAVMVFTVIISVAPIIWVFISSFKTNNSIMTHPFALPDKISFDAYIYLFSEYDFLSYIKNSVITSFVPTLLSLIIFTMGAYVIAKYKFPGKGLFFALFTITLLVPSHSRTQPIYSLMGKLNLFDSLAGLSLVYLSTGMAMSMFILKTAFQSIPDEITEAGVIDGASFPRIFFNLNLPLAKSGIVTAGVLMFLGNWNEYFYASLLLTSNENKTLPAIATAFTSMFQYSYPKTFAALTLLVVPGILMYAFAQRQVQESLASSAVKG